MKSRLHPLDVEFKFAGFSWPRYVGTLPKGSFEERMKPWVCGPYYHAPRPRKGGVDNSTSFYLESEFMPLLRWRWADEAADLRHRGWYCDEYGDIVLRGLVMRLPRQRGFIAGYSMGVGMISDVEYTIFGTEREAARYADGLAEIAAQKEMEYQETQRYEAECATKKQKAQDDLLDLTDRVRDQLSKIDELLFEANLVEAQKLLRSVADSIDVALEQVKDG